MGVKLDKFKPKSSYSCVTLSRTFQLSLTWVVEGGRGTSPTHQHIALKMHY